MTFSLAASRSVERRHGRGRIALSASVCACLLLLPLHAVASEQQRPRTCTVGAYLISLHDFDPAESSFGADLWLWSTCATPDLRPLDVMDFVNAKEVRTSLAATYERSGVYWTYVKASGTFRHAWEERNYPFDRQVLRIVGENTNAPAAEFSYTADREGSKPSRDIELDGWRITSFDLATQRYVYDTTFGDPAFAGADESDYSRIVVSVGIERTKLFSFFKLVTGVYVAVALSALSFLLGPYNGRRRLGVLAGTLFAVLVNQRVAESVIGRTESVTLVDQIHIVAMVTIFAIAVAGIHAQVLFDRGQQDRATRNDIRGLWVTAVTFVIVNAILIGVAARG